MDARVKRKIWITMSVFLLSVLTQTSIANPNLVGWWKFDEGSGVDVLDNSGHGNHGTFMGDPQWVTGPDGDALEFDGVDDWIEVPHDATLTVDTEVTVMAWINTGRFISPTGDNWQGIIAKGNPRSYSLYTHVSGALHFSTAGVGSLSSTKIPLNEWVHVCAMVTGGAHQYYINGEDAGTGGSGIALPGATDSATVRIGNARDANREFLGMIDDVRIYNRALTSDELNRLWGDYPINYYPLDVDAGYYPSIVWQDESVTVQLDASIYDNDPCGFEVLNLQWSKVSGPGDVHFYPANDIEDPCAVFSTPGIYILLLQAWDETPQKGSDIAIIRIKETQLGEVHADDIVAWEKLKNLEIPGINVDQHFNIGDTRYVSLTGSDSNAGTIDNPWRTLSKATSSMTADRVIYLREGTYYGPVGISTKATPIRPAALRGYPGEHVIIQYPQSFIDENRSVDHYAPLIGISGYYVEVSNLHLIGARDQLPQNKYSENGISFSGGGGEGCRILYNQIENVGHCGVKEMGHGGHRFLIEGNYVHDVGQTSHDHGIYCPADDATIRKNLITNSTGWGIHAYTSPVRLEITHNIFIGHAQDGIVLGGSDCRVLHNIFYQNTQGGLFFFRRNCRNNIVKNNIFDEPNVDFRVDSKGSNDPNEYPQNNLVDYNCFSRRTQKGWFSPYDTYGPNNFIADPKWVNPDMLDFRLTNSSPCINAGEDLGFGSNCGPFYDYVQVISIAEDFETGDFIRFKWVFSGDADWTVTSDEYKSGSYSARAGSIGNDRSSTLQLTLDCISGEISFYYKVSSEHNFDRLRFYIDGIQQDQWSGNEDWTEVSFPVIAGKRTFEWIYSKDGSSSYGSDTVWIDDIVFPIE